MNLDTNLWFKGRTLTATLTVAILFYQTYLKAIREVEII